MKKSNLVNWLKRYLLPIFHSTVFLYCIFLLKDTINQYYKEYVNFYLVPIYDFLENEPQIFVILSVYILSFSIYQLYKQSKNKCFSYIRMNLLIIAFYILYNSEELKWLYMQNNYIDIRWTLILIIIISGMIEIFKRLDWNVKSKEDDSSYSLTTPKTNMYDIRNKDYLDALIRNIQKIDVNNESFAIGITSNWGAGKSTFINALNENIKKNIKNSLVISFNPWKSTSKELIIKDFFATLKMNIMPIYRKFGSIITEYTNLLVDVSENKPLEKYYNLFLKKGQYSSIELQDKIEKILDEINYTIYIFIDDIDRLDKDELFEVLKLIRNSASFKRLVYIVPYDKNYILKSLSSKGIASPEIYLKKIFPLELALPSFEYHVLPKYLLNELNRLIITPYQLENFSLKKEIFKLDKDLHRPMILNYLHTFRDVKNFSIAFAANLLCYIYPKYHIDDIAIENFFWLEIIRYAESNLYSKLRDNPMSVLDLSNNENTNFLQHYIIKDIKSAYSKSLSLIFSADCLQPYKSIIYKINYNKYFSYRLASYNLDSKIVLEKMFASDAEQAQWLDLTFSNPVDFVSDFMYQIQNYDLKEIDREHIKQYFHFVCEWLKYNKANSTYLVKVLRKNRFNNKLTTLYQEDFIATIKSVISQFNQKNCVFLSGLLNSSYSVLTNNPDESTLDQKTILTNDHIKELMNYNLDKFLSFSGTESKLENLINENSWFGYIFRMARVIVEIDNNILDDYNYPRYIYDNLLLDKIIEHFEIHRNTNDYQVFLDYFRPKFDVDYEYEPYYYDEIIDNNINKICKVFGTVTLYGKFLDRCFKIENSEKLRYAEFCHIDILG